MLNRIYKADMKRKIIKLIIVLLPIISCYSAAYWQDESNDIEAILETYNASIGQFINLYGCGHILDAPAYALKKTQNITLDALLLLDGEDEEALGREVMKEMRSALKIQKDHWAEPTVKSILGRLQKHVERKEISYKVHIVVTEEINAFATVGGNIFVTTALMDFVESNDELAFIIGHEIAHVDRYHTLRKYKKLALAASITDLVNMDQLTSVASDIDLVLNAPFDQIDEYEADQYGVELAKKAGFNAQRFTDFFKKQAQYENKDIVGKLMGTHPFAEDRVNCMQEYINK